MPPRTVLNLQIVCDDAHAYELAATLRQRLPTDQWRLLAQVSMEILALYESEAAGQKIVVVPASERAAEVERALRLRPAGLA